MGRSHAVVARLGLAGVITLATGTALLGGVVIETLSSSAYADSAPYEVFCPGTPLGGVVLNNVVMTGALSPTSPTTGQVFNLTGLQTEEQLPAAIVQDAAETGLTSLTGTLTTTVDAIGATPTSLSTGPVSFTIPIPNPIPSSGVTITIPSVTVGPFTATSDNIAMSAAPEAQTMDIDGDGIGLLDLHCATYPNDALASGFTSATPPGEPISPVIATAGDVTTPPPSTLTGPYELYCPHTPVGDLDFNDVTTSATISPPTLSAGDPFQVTGYQISIPIPLGPVTAAVGLGNDSFEGLATSYVDAYGTTTSQLATGSMSFDVPIPSPIPSTGLSLDLPSSSTTIGPFTAVGGPVTIAQDQSVLVVAELSGKGFTMSCTAYPNDSLASSGSTGTPPATTPIEPIIAVANASGTPITTTTEPGGPGTGSQTPGSPYELYCPGTPVGDIAVNDVVTTGSITPTSLNEGDDFQVTNLQTQFTIPQDVAQQAENLGLTTLSGDLSLFLDVSGTQGISYTTTSTSTSSSTATSTSVNPGGPTVGVDEPYPGPYPGEDDMTFSVTLPSPVPPTGVQFTATLPPDSATETFIAAGGPIDVSVDGANLDVSAFGDEFGLFCNTFVNDTVPTGLSIHQPNDGFIQPLVATGSATTIPPPPGPPGAYELYCPGTPVGNIVLNDVSTTAALSPSDPTPGQQFSLTGYQTTLTVPFAIATAASALGNTAIAGYATASIDANGATPAQISTNAMSFDDPLPSPVPQSGVTVTVPSAPGTIGPFTASSSAITISQDGKIQLVLTVSGNSLTMNCSTYANNSAPTGIVETVPPGRPQSPVIAIAGGGATSTPPGANVVVTPATGLSGGQSVSITGSGFTANSTGNILECNDALNQPTVALPAPVSSPLAVGCTSPSYHVLASTSATGELSTTYDVVAGTLGPPCGTSADIVVTCPSTDSAGGDPATDAADYPCPPTPAQQAEGVTCSLRFGDEAGDSADATIVFDGQEATPSTTDPTTGPTADPTTDPTTTDPATADPTNDTTTTAPSTTTTPSSSSPSTSSPAGSTTTAASQPSAVAAAVAGSSSSSDPPIVSANSGSLAFTGTGPLAQWLAVVGVALMLLGMALLVVIDAPRRLLTEMVKPWRASHHGPARARRAGRGADWFLGR